MSFDQVMILLTGVPAVFITQCKLSWMRWAPVLGMIGQPFWIYSSWHAHVWGMLFVNCLYTFAWGKGIFTYWIEPARRRRQLDLKDVYTWGEL